jgi:transposase
MGKKSELTIEERTEVVLALLRKEEPAAALSRRYQISEQTLYRWRDQFLAGGKERLGKGEDAASKESEKRIEKLERDLAKRAQIIGELTIANDILKKIQILPR